MAATSGPESFFVSWWYSPDTKLGVYFNNFGIANGNNPLTALNNKGLDDTNGMSASIQESYRYSNIVTNHPVENTPSISDHIIIQPVIITITGLITSLTTIPISGNGIISFSQLGNATEILVNMAKSRTGLTLTTGLLFGSRYARFDNLAVETLELPRTNEYGRSSIKFTITFKQLIITNTNSQVTPNGYSQAVLTNSSNSRLT